MMGIGSKAPSQLVPRTASSLEVVSYAICNGSWAPDKVNSGGMRFLTCSVAWTTDMGAIVVQG